MAAGDRQRRGGVLLFIMHEKMRRLVFIALAAALGAVPAGAQEWIAVDFAATARTEGMYQSGGGPQKLTMGQSSLYTLADVSLGSGWSLSVCNHWLRETPDALYRNSKYAWEDDWLDWANVSFETGDLKFTLGKDVLSLGGMETDEYDFDCYSQLMSRTWNSLAFYQWGGKVAWTFAPGNSVEFQLASSPTQELYFDSMAYSLCWRGEPYDNLSLIWSANVFGNKGTDDYDWMFALGNRYDLDDLSFIYDVYVSKEAQSDKHSPSLEQALSAVYSGIDGLDVTAKAGLYSGGRFFGGVALEYKPEFVTSDCRLHLVAGAHPLFGGFTVTSGLTFVL